MILLPAGMALRKTCSARDTGASTAGVLGEFVGRAQACSKAARHRVGSKYFMDSDLKVAGKKYRENAETLPHAASSFMTPEHAAR
jgi:hypothetical protein